MSDPASRPTADRVLVGPPLEAMRLWPKAVDRALSVRAAAKDAPETIALVAGGRELDYAALAARCGATANARVPGELRAFVGAPTLPAAVAIYGAVDRGVAVAPLHPRLDEEARAALAAGLPHAAPPGAFAVLHTSGSSGRPKRVVLSRRAIVASAAAAGHALGRQADDRWLCALPLAHVGGLSILTRCLIARVTAVLAGPDAARGGPALHDLLAKERVTVVSLVPTQLVDLLATGRRAPAGLRRVVLGGAAAAPALLARAADAGYAVATTYGMTETASLVACDGEIVAGAEVRVAAASGRIWVRGAMAMDGYLRGDEVVETLGGREDADTLAPPVADADPAAAADDDERATISPPIAGGAPIPGRWLATGDLGRVDGDRLVVLGRADDAIVTGGEKVHPAEVEATLAAIDGVRAACVFGVADERWGAVVACALVTHDEQKPAGMAAALARLAPYQRPRRIALLPELVIGSGGKLDRAATAALAIPRLDAG